MSSQFWEEVGEEKRRTVGGGIDILVYSQFTVYLESKVLTSIHIRVSGQVRKRQQVT